MPKKHIIENLRILKKPLTYLFRLNKKNSRKDPGAHSVLDSVCKKNRGSKRLEEQSTPLIKSKIIDFRLQIIRRTIHLAFFHLGPIRKLRIEKKKEEKTADKTKRNLADHIDAALIKDGTGNKRGEGKQQTGKGEKDESHHAEEDMQFVFRKRNDIAGSKEKKRQRKQKRKDQEEIASHGREIQGLGYADQKTGSKKKKIEDDPQRKRLRRIELISERIQKGVLLLLLQIEEEKKEKIKVEDKDADDHQKKRNLGHIRTLRWNYGTQREASSCPRL